MRLFFRRSPAGTTTEELPLAADETRPDIPPDPTPDSAPDPPAHEISFAPQKDLVPASRLPSAASVLADLFSDASPAPPQRVDPVREPAAPVAAAVPASEPEIKPPAPEPPPPAPPAPVAISPPEAELCAEDAATVLAAASEEIAGTEPPSASENTSRPDNEGSLSSLSRPFTSASDWALEEALALHREWVESKGTQGKKADLANAELSGSELIGVNLRFADLHYADLKGCDLLLADLRDSCMVRADLEEACLVGANLEGANLEGASLETALGLVPRQLAGANLREASLPPQIAAFPAQAAFRTASRSALRFFAVILSLCTLSALAVWKTKDIQLVTDSAILPFLHSSRFAAAMPTAEIFLIAPFLLFLLYLAFIAQTQRMWAAALELPAVFPDGSTLGEKEPSILVGLLRAHFRWMNQDAPSTRTLETTVCLLAAYWVVPVMLLLFWVRCLTRQEIHGTVFQEVLAALAAGVALHATFKVGRPPERWTQQQSWTAYIEDCLRRARPPVMVGVLLAFLTFLSFGTIAGVPHDPGRAPQFGSANIRRWAPTALWWVGFDPFADLTEASVSTPPAGWNGSDDQVPSVRGIRLNSTRLRYAQAYGAFFANAHLWHADFRGAYLSDADFRSTDLSQSDLRYALMDGVHMNHANLDRANLPDTHLARADFRDANLSYADLSRAFLMDARFDGASLYDARLSGANLVRVSFFHSDLRNAVLESANLEHADFRQAYLWSANLQNADLKGAELGSAILIGASLRGADLGGAHFSETVLTDTNLSGADLDGADLRGAFGLTVAQICSSRSHAGALFDDAFASQVALQCGLGH